MTSRFAGTPTRDRESTRRSRRGRSVLKRALFGVVFLSVMVSGVAWLMYAGIDADAEGMRDALPPYASRQADAAYGSPSVENDAAVSPAVNRAR